MLSELWESYRSVASIALGASTTLALSGPFTTAHYFAKIVTTAIRRMRGAEMFHAKQNSNRVEYDPSVIEVTEIYLRVIPSRGFLCWDCGYEIVSGEPLLQRGGETYHEHCLPIREADSATTFHLMSGEQVRQRFPLATIPGEDAR